MCSKQASYNVLFLCYEECMSCNVGQTQTQTVDQVQIADSWLGAKHTLGIKTVLCQICDSMSSYNYTQHYKIAFP